MSVDPSAAPPRRIPKLKVRNRIDDVEPPTHLRSLVPDGTPISPPSSRDARSPVNEDDDITPIASRVPTQIRKPSRPDLESRNSNRSDVSDDRQDPARPGSAYTYYSQGQSVDLGRSSNFSPSLAPSSKKKSRLWGSLLLKEPSTNAWKDFAELQRQEQALKGNQSKPLLIEKKLPEHIPKVNSKWNGLPDHAQPPKGKPWKSSLDISRSSHSRASGYTGATTGASRPGSGHSGRSSNSSNKTAKRVTSKGSDTPSGGSSKSTRTTSSKRPTTADRLGPAMSTDSLESPSPLREPSSIPASSLFFPAEPTPPTYTSRTNLAPRTPTASQVPTTIIAAPSPPTSLFDSLKIPQGPRIPPAAASRDDLDLTMDVVSHDSSLSDEEPTPTQERAPIIDTATFPRPNTTALSPQTSPTLSDASSSLPSPTLGGPHNFHNRFKKQYKTIEEIPQWPLPTKPEDVVLEPEPDHLTPTAPPKSHERLSSNSSVDSPTQPSFFFSQTDGTNSSRTSSEDSSPVSPILPSAVVHPLGINMNHSKYYPPSAPTSPNNARLAPLIAPAFQPGRVKTRPFDLDTIAESDAGSIRAPSLYLSPNRSVVSVLNEQQQQFTTTAIPRVSLAGSRASSEMSEQWHMSPEERTGLGAKFKARAAPWQVQGSHAIRSDGSWNVEEDADQRKKSGLIGRFRR